MTTQRIFIRNTKKIKEKRIHKILLEYGYSLIQKTDKGVILEIEPDRIKKVISKINDIEFGVAELF